MKIRVIKASGDLFWYANKIGEVFDVNAEPEYLAGRLNYILSTDDTYAFEINDVEVILQCRYPESSEYVE